MQYSSLLLLIILLYNCHSTEQGIIAQNCNSDRVRYCGKIDIKSKHDILTCYQSNFQLLQPNCQKILSLHHDCMQESYKIMQKYCKNQRTYSCMAKHMATELPKECHVFKRVHRRRHPPWQHQGPSRQQPQKARYPQQVQKAGYPQQVQKAGYPQQVQKARYPQQAQKARYPQQVQKAGYPQQVQKAAYAQQQKQAAYAQQQKQAAYAQQQKQAAYAQQQRQKAIYAQQQKQAAAYAKQQKAAYAEQQRQKAAYAKQQQRKAPFSRRKAPSVKYINVNKTTSFFTIDGQEFLFSSKNLIGEGKFGKIYMARNKINPQYVIAVKQMKYNIREQGDEVGALKAIGDFMGEDPVRGLIGMSWHRGKNVKDLLQLGLSPQRKLIVTKHALAQLKKFHEKGWVHRDLRAENIIVSPDFSQVWLVDLGLAQPLNKFKTSQRQTLKELDVAKLRSEIQGQFPK